jgi:membrane protease YdiL (CAAX protease family)
MERASWPSLSSFRRHPVVAAMTATLAFGVLAIGWEVHHVSKAVVYLAAMLAGVLTTDLVADLVERRGPSVPRTPAETFPVRRPREETLVILVCALLGLTTFMLVKLLPDPAHITPRRLALPDLALRLIAMAFLFPVVPAIFLLWRRYRPTQLGFSLPRPMAMLLVAVPVQAIVIGAAYAISPGEVTWPEILREASANSAGPAGIAFNVATVALLAAIPEEFFRLIVQTRVGTLFRNQAAAWLGASVLWALMHVPTGYANQPPEVAGFTRWLHPLLGAITIVPIGLLWSYVTWRTRSLYPALLLHATNVWGLQNV